MNGWSIHVLGEVTRPGTVELKPNERLITAIEMAGGLTAQAAETRIELHRGKSVVKTIDILSLLRDGNLSNNPFLQENDVVFVPRRLASVTIQGPIRYPGTYEIKPQVTTLDDIVTRSGRYTVGVANGFSITVTRYDDSNERKVFKIINTTTDLSAFKLMDGDTIHIPHKFNIKNNFDDTVETLPDDNFAVSSASKDVFILGGVKQPGKFKFAPQFDANKYVTLAGGLTRLGREEGIIYRTNGEKDKFNLSTPVVINPGDTVILAEDRLGPEFWITFIPTLITLGLGLYNIAK